MKALRVPANFRADAPEIAVTAIPDCPVCGGRERQWFASGHDYEIETCRNRWDFWSCSSCETVWLDPRPADRELSTIYPPTYYAYNMEQNVSSFAMKGKMLLDRRKIANILRHAERPPQSYLDIGCGNGRYLDLFAKQGIAKEHIFGLELSESQVETLRHRGFNAWCRRVEDCTEIAPESIDLATMFHVIEHVADPDAVIGRVAEWLRPGGRLVIETPNVAALDARLFAGRWWGGLHIPRHWTLFQQNSLDSLLNRNGLEIESVGYQTGHSFWMYSLHHVFKYNTIRPMPLLARCFDPLKGLPFLIAFTAFDTIRRLLGLRTSSLLMVARKPEVPPPAA